MNPVRAGFALLVLALLVLACTPKVRPADPSGGGGSTAASTGGSMSAGESTSVGVGGSTTTATGAGGATGGSGGAPSSSTDASASVGAGGAGTYACTNAPDTAIIQTKDIVALSTTCAQNNSGGEPATKNCIATSTGLSSPCVTCIDDSVQCVAAKCLNPCISDYAGQACKDCRSTNCDPALTACSGVTFN